MPQGTLFTEDFLKRGIKETDAWKELDDATLAALRAELRNIVESFPYSKNPNETRTEDDVIWPVLESLGWHWHARQVSLSPKGRIAIPDGLLFGDESAKKQADVHKEEFRHYAHGLAVVESKRWDRKLDHKDMAPGEDSGVPSSQMLRYLRRVDDLTRGKVRWGILTNGRLWRLYFQGSRSVPEDFFEIDLATLTGASGFDATLLDGDVPHYFKVFALMFRREAFLPTLPDERTFHQLSIDEGRLWEARVTQELSHVVFDKAFPGLVTAIAASDPERPKIPNAAYLAQVRDGALILLYRLLFILYAEDRDLLPFREKRYDDYGLNRKVREEVAQRVDKGDTFVTETGYLYGHLRALFRVIDRGAASIGIPPYNGGLFNGAETPILERVDIPDSTLAPVIDALSREKGDDRPARINYRDLSVQHLGSIYERLLENEVILDEDGAVAVAADERSRKGTGSYYTSEQAVQLIIHQAIDPLLDQRMSAFTERAALLASDKRPKTQRIADLKAFDPAERFLDIKVCDPAMGSGHFLVSLVDVLAARVLAAVEEAHATVTWCDKDEPYQSPLAARIVQLREQILEQARARGWSGVQPERLDDRQIVRRMILKRVVFGVDKNPMAVELAKVALWLHTFTVGAPLSFLEHHLRCGDSLFGEWVRPVEDRLVKSGQAMLIHQSIRNAKEAAKTMAFIENLSDADIAEVQDFAKGFQDVADRTRPLTGFLDFMHTLRWLANGVKGKEERKRRDEAVNAFLDRQFGDPVAISGGADPIAPPPSRSGDLLPDDRPTAPSMLGEPADPSAFEAFIPLLREAKNLAAEQRFMHWQVAFPCVWENWDSATPSGGFDAIIGNPPYVRQESLGAAKPVLKDLYKSFHGQADLYVYFYEQGLNLLRPGGRLSYIVTNKWLRAGYAEPLRRLFGTAAWTESLVDFGHAKQFFPDADVFPCVITVRRPASNEKPPLNTRVAVIPREKVRLEDLPSQVAEAGFNVARASLAAEAWRMERPDVNALLDKIRANGVPLKEYVGSSPLYGIKTGFNQAFLIDSATRDRLIAEDPRSTEIIKP
jgi:hypothetical protein